MPGCLKRRVGRPAASISVQVQSHLNLAELLSWQQRRLVLVYVIQSSLATADCCAASSRRSVLRNSAAYPAFRHLTGPDERVHIRLFNSLTHSTDVVPWRQWASPSSRPSCPCNPLKVALLSLPVAYLIVWLEERCNNGDPTSIQRPLIVAKVHQEILAS